MTTPDLQTEEVAKAGELEVAEGIQEAKDALGESLTILGHHYQRDEVIRFADYVGDSLGLSRRAAELETSRFIVFCGVHFMAETAAILCKPEQVVIQPVANALCPMARLANADEVTQAWKALEAVWGDDIIPITYQNSIAEVKAFVGRHGGAVCTSSNAADLFRWALDRKGHLLFVPDEHLGRNTALAMGLQEDEIGLWDPYGTPDAATLAHCRVLVWKGFCYVHRGFSPQDVDAARRAHPDALVVVHPECPREVVDKADASGSTTAIIRFVEAAPSGSTIYVGTEWHLVNRLANKYDDKRILPLCRMTCRTMEMTTAKHLLCSLQQIRRGILRNIVSVDAETAKWARIALERMLEAG